MSNYQLFAQFIKDISGQANIISIPKIYIRLTGDIKTALFLSQCVYWSDKSSRTDGYFYKTAEEWQEETGISRHELARIREELKDYIETKIMRANGAPTVHYKPDLVKIAQWIADYYLELQKSNDTDLHENGKSNCTKGANSIDEKGQMDLQEIVKSLTTITTASTTANTSTNRGAKKPRTPKPPDPEKERQKAEAAQIATTLSEITGMDFEKNRAQLLKEAKHYNISDLSRLRTDYIGKEAAWYLYDWRGVRGEKPGLYVIRQTFGNLTPANGNGIPRPNGRAAPAVGLSPEARARIKAKHAAREEAQ